METGWKQLRHIQLLSASWRCDGASACVFNGTRPRYTREIPFMSDMWHWGGTWLQLSTLTGQVWSEKMLVVKQDGVSVKCCVCTFWKKERFLKLLGGKRVRMCGHFPLFLDSSRIHKSRCLWAVWGISACCGMSGPNRVKRSQTCSYLSPRRQKIWFFFFEE